MLKVFFFIGTVISLSIISENASAQTDFKFDFGTGKVAPGYKKVVSTSDYNDQQGYGFDYNSKTVAIDRGSNDPLRSDFCTGNAPFFFSVKVPEGNYKVTVTLGDLWQNSVTTIKAESRRLMEKEIKNRCRKIHHGFLYGEYPGQFTSKRAKSDIKTEGNK